MKKICFATNNPHKLREIRQILENDVEIISLQELGCHDEIPETQATLEGNSLEKAQYLFDRYHIPVFADDTGLEVTALGGEPGVFSARYAGPQRSATDNIKKLLTALESKKDRTAQFRTVITYLDENLMKQFEGVVEGEITDKLLGDEGFGYDPVFIPSGSDRTFAEMGPIEKNQWSHRGKAIKKLVEFLKGKNK